MKRKCLECGEEFEGRVDKKFCCDQCRNTYNNRLHKDYNNLMRNINNILRKNRRILQEFANRKKLKVKRSTLIQKGFDFNYMTNTYTTQKGKTYIFCYDIGYMVLDDTTVGIFERKDYV